MLTGLKQAIPNLTMTIVYVINNQENVPLMETMSSEVLRANQNLNAFCNVQFCRIVNITPGLVKKTKIFLKNVFFFLHVIMCLTRKGVTLGPLIVTKLDTVQNK